MCYCLIFSTVIGRALASFLQYVGLVKPEYDVDDENGFQPKFYELLRRYSKLT